MKKVAVIGAILEQPKENQHKFNDVVSSFNGIIKGRLGIPLPEEDIAVISLTVISDMDEINELTGKLGSIPGVSVKTALSKKEIV